MTMQTPCDPIIAIEGLKNHLGGRWVHSDVNLSVHSGEIIGVIGGSGCGKTTLLRSILMLQEPTAGTIRVFGKDLSHLDERATNAIRHRWGVLFQHSALFSTLNVVENIMFPMQELTELPMDFIKQLAMLKLALVGLSEDVMNKYPAQLSGGMQRRVAAARAIAMDPELLFLDEPTSGLDPLSAKQFDKLILFLRDALNLTIVIVSHDIDSLQRTSNRVAFLGDGKVLAVEPLDILRKNSHPLIADYFSKI